MVRSFTYATILVGMFPIAAFALAVKIVKIENTGMNIEKGDRNPPGVCKSFKPTTLQVKRFFNRAHPVPDQFVYKDRYTPCYAEGTIEFGDGNSGKWRIYSSGAATLEFDLGGAVSLFYKDRKWLDPTACTYGNDLPHDC